MSYGTGHSKRYIPLLFALDTVPFNANSFIGHTGPKQDYPRFTRIGTLIAYEVTSLRLIMYTCFGGAHLLLVSGKTSLTHSQN